MQIRAFLKQQVLGWGCMQLMDHVVGQSVIETYKTKCFPKQYHLAAVAKHLPVAAVA